MKTEMISLLLAVALLAIVMHWKNKTVPTLQSWRISLWNYFILGKTAIQNSQSLSCKSYERFMELWYPIRQYLTEKEVLPKSPYYHNLIHFLIKSTSMIQLTQAVLAKWGFS